MSRANKASYDGSADLGTPTSPKDSRAHGASPPYTPATPSSPTSRKRSKPEQATETPPPLSCAMITSRQFNNLVMKSRKGTPPAMLDVKKLLEEINCTRDAFRNLDYLFVPYIRRPNTRINGFRKSHSFRASSLNIACKEAKGGLLESRSGEFVNASRRRSRYSLMLVPMLVIEEGSTFFSTDTRCYILQ